MKTIKTSIPLLLILLAAACSKSETPGADTGNLIRLTVALEDSRVALTSDDKLEWEATDTIGVLIGNNSSKSEDLTTSRVVPLPTLKGCPGVFSGEINLGPFTASDIRGIVYPYDPANSWVRYNSGLRLVMQVGKEPQNQTANGVLEGRNAPLFAVVGIDGFTRKGDNDYILEGQTLSWGCSVLKFNIFGKKPSTTGDEFLQSVTLTGSVKGIAGTAEWKIASNSFAFNASISTPITVNLAEKCTPASATRENPIGVYMCTLPRSDSQPTLAKLTVRTDRAVYEKTISYSTFLKPGVIQPFDVDLSTFD